MSTTEEMLDDVWHGISTGSNLNPSDASSPDMIFAVGFATAAHAFGHITAVELEGWKSRFKRCPDKEDGHPGRGNGGWCAYCGTVYNDADLEDAGNLSEAKS